MSYIEDKRIYYVNSANRTAGEHSNFSYKFDIPINKFDYVVCLDLSIPKTYYLIQSDRNSFTLKEDNKQEIITIPEGNYSTISFSKYMAQELTNKSPNGYQYKITMNNQGKFEYEVKDNNSETKSLDFITDSNESETISFIFTDALYEQFGFEPNSENKFINNKLVSKNIPDFQPESTLFLRSDIISSGYGDNVLQQVFCEGVSEFKYVIYECKDVQAYAKKLNSSASNEYYFKLTNENNDYINTNGRNLVFTLMLFKKSHSNENLNSFIKYIVKYIDDFRNKRI